MRATPEEYERLDLRAHSLLADVPLHDVWEVDLPGGAPDLSMTDLRDLLSTESFTSASLAARLLFALRAGLGRVFGWDHEPPEASRESFRHRLSDDDRARCLVPPGTPQGPFRVLLALPRESILEIRNATVHAFSVFALTERPGGHRLYWAIYVRPVGAITSFYMQLIDPFRRWVIYPAVLRHLREVWQRRVAQHPACCSFSGGCGPNCARTSASSATR